MTTATPSSPGPPRPAGLDAGRGVGRLSMAFGERRGGRLPGLIPYVTAGYPRLGSTPGLLVAAERAGCLAAEVGIPFSDPLADGPTIQRSGHRALANGMTPERALDQVAAARAAGLTLPLAVMTYVNPVLAMGPGDFCAAAAAAGADALIVPDLPRGEDVEVRAAARACGLALVPMVAPTTTDARLDAACADAEGFIYCVSVTGTTGARQRIADSAFDLLARVGARTRIPRALGFGLSRHEHLEALTSHSEAAVVGAALIDAIAGDEADAEGVLERFCTGLIAPPA